MKVIGLIALVVGLAMSTIWVGTWIAIASERGVIEAVRLGFYDWPKSAAQFTLLAFSLLFTVGGLSILVHKEGPH